MATESNSPELVSAIISRIKEIITTLTEESQKAALDKCQELGFDENRGEISLNDAFSNLIDLRLFLTESINQNKFSALPIAIQRNILTNLESISKFQTNLINGSDDVVNLVNSIEQLNATIWQYGLKNISDEMLSYERRLKEINRLRNDINNVRQEAKKLQTELVRGVKLKGDLEQLLNDVKNGLETVQKTVLMAEENSKKVASYLTETTDAYQKAQGVIGVIKQNESSTSTLVAEVKASKTAVQSLEAEIKKFYGQIEEYREKIKTSEQKADQVISDNNSKAEALLTRLVELEDQIKDKLQKATGYSLFNSFQTRKEVLARSKARWVIAIALLLLASASWSFFLWYTTDSIGTAFYLKLTMSAPIIFAIWFCAAQYSRERKLEEEYAFKSNISVSLVPYKDLLDGLIEQDKETEREKYSAFIIDSITKVFTSPTDRVFHSEDKQKGLSERSLRKALSTLEQIAKILRP